MTDSQKFISDNVMKIDNITDNSFTSSISKSCKALTEFGKSNKDQEHESLYVPAKNEHHRRTPSDTSRIMQLIDIESNHSLIKTINSGMTMMDIENGEQLSQSPSTRHRLATRFSGINVSSKVSAKKIK